MSTLQKECAACRRCPHGETRTQTVFAKGDPLSTLCFVGEAPGEEEDAQGLPFVGDSGRFLDRQITAMRGVEFPASPYVCNVLKCRPPGNKLLKDGSDIAACSPHLWAQLRSLPNLRVIVAVGKTSSRMLSTLRDENMNALRGRTFIVGGTKNLDVCANVKIYPVYHPAYLLRRRNDKALHVEAWADLKRAVEGLR